MLKELRCGDCKKLLCKIGKFTEFQIKCSRCGTLNHVKVANLERSPTSELHAAVVAENHTTS
ncbi:Com family DNA-binding transcriptional regulator [Pseudomonas sp. fls2-241-R2A-110]|uniref:Com family DNA-binding transcriptional regulator n=1 Tax=Pseudomonas sp. fls2-241-R2A-110 TaxID=3040311 RepID=UPI0025527AFD|nr:Com family DNA-binding transcriptional regulator [Pseudomonas sp. fls2-241-R2A-110]